MPRSRGLGSTVLAAGGGAFSVGGREAGCSMGFRRLYAGLVKKGEKLAQPLSWGSLKNDAPSHCLFPSALWVQITTIHSGWGGSPLAASLGGGARRAPPCSLPRHVSFSFYLRKCHACGEHLKICANIYHRVADGQTEGVKNPHSNSQQNPPSPTCVRPVMPCVPGNE